MWSVKTNTHEKTQTAAAQELSQVSFNRWVKNTEKESLCCFTALSLRLPRLVWDYDGIGVPKEPFIVAAALRKTSQGVQPSTNATLLAVCCLQGSEQQWSFVACLIVDNKLWALCEQEKENRDRNLART